MEIPSGIACPKCGFIVFTAQALLDHHELYDIFLVPIMMMLNRIIRLRLILLRLIHDENRSFAPIRIILFIYRSHVPNHRAPRILKMPHFLAERNERFRKTIVYNNLEIGDTVRVVHYAKVY